VVAAAQQTEAAAAPPAAQSTLLTTAPSQSELRGADSAAADPASQMADDPEFRAALANAAPLLPAAYATQPFRLRLHHLHTLEDIDIVYRVGDTYQPEAVAQLNYFLRDHRTFEVKAFDPREFDLLHDVLVQLNRPDGEIDVVCGYRTQWSNDLLRASSRGVAEHSQHMLGHAIDIQVPGASTERLRDAALALNEGGVGYYPVSRFVHVDVGAIRTWTYSPRRARHRAHLRTAAHPHAKPHRRPAHAVGL
jgi:uncharacterized protein YcbK (DUF882 family)